MRRAAIPSPRSNPKMSFVVSIAVALILTQGLRSLVGAASLPLETALTGLLNAVLVRGWRNVIFLWEPHYPLLMVGSTAFMGFVLLGIGLAIGAGVVRRAKSED